MSEIDLFNHHVELPKLLPLTVKNPIKISYSKGQAFKACERKFKYAHIELHVNDPKKPGLMPKKKATALARGSFGHAVMEHAMNELMPQDFPYSQESCVAAANNAIVWGMAQPDNEHMPTIMKQIMHFMANVFPVNGWRILAVEQEYMLPVGKDPVSGRDVVYPFTVDLVIEINGLIYIVDYKFAADDYSEDRIDIEPQIPGYIGAMRALGINVANGWYVFMRTRKMNNVEEQVVVKPVRPNEIRIKQSFKEHLITTAKVIKFQNEDAEPTRNAGNNCDYCDFKKICAIELRGEDASLMKQIDFVANEYGYEEV
jgi:hypothetical protein